MRRAGTRAVERCQSVAKHHNQTTCRCATRRARLSVASCGPHARPRRRSASARRCGHDPVACGLLPNLLSGVWRRADSVRAIFYEEEEGAGPEGAHGSPSVAHELGGGKGAIAPVGIRAPDKLSATGRRPVETRRVTRQRRKSAGTANVESTPLFKFCVRGVPGFGQQSVS